MRARILPKQTFDRTERLFMMLLGLIYLIAFASLWPQMQGLVGENGIIPAADLLTAMRSDFGWRAFLYAPTLFWLHPTDGMLNMLCGLGCASGLVMMLGKATRTAAFACYALYLSLVSIGSPFTSFQWDALLLEAGFLAVFAGSPLLPVAYRLLLFRLMFESGAVKLISHDPNWRNLHALRYHFWTQPLPNPLAYHLHHAPCWLLDTLTLVTLLIELLAPFLLRFPSRGARTCGVGLLVALQVFILLTGNYAFFNWLTIALCLWGLDDSFFQQRWIPAKPPARSGMIASALVVMLGVLGIWQICRQLLPGNFLPAFPATLEAAEIVNSYGLFAVMTTTRNEIVFEASDNGVEWHEWDFRWKPGPVKRRLPVVAPFQPRLDWQMWFVSLGDPRDNRWVETFAYRLLERRKEVLSLLAPAPLATAPKLIRAKFYRYEFTETTQDGYWRRTPLGEWFPTVFKR